MAVNGIHFLSTLGSLGSAPQKRSMGCDKTGVSVYKRGSVGIRLIAVWSGDGFSYTTDDLGMERSA